MDEGDTGALAGLVAGFTLLPLPGLVIDGDLRIRRVNEALLAVTGRTPQALAGQPVQTLFLLDEGEGEALSAQLAGRAASPRSFRLKSEGNAPCWMIPQSRPLPGAIVGSEGLRLVLLADVSARRAAEEGLRQSAMAAAALEETLRLLHPSRPPIASLGEMAERLAGLIGAAVIFIGRRLPRAHRVEPLAAGGAARDFLAGLSFTDDPARPEGQGAVGTVLREGGTATLRYDDPRFDRPEFAAFLARARRFGVAAVSAAAADTQAGERVVLAAGFGTAEEMEGLPSRLLASLAETIAAYFDRLALARHHAGIEALRRARRRVAEHLLRTESEEETFRTLAAALAEEMPGISVDVLVPREGRLVRLACAGPLAAVIAALPEPPTEEPPPDQPLQVPTQIWLTRCPITVESPAERRRAQPAWREAPLSEVGCLMGWPVARKEGGEAFGVVVLFLPKGVMLDPEQREIVESILDNAALGLLRLEERRMISDLARTDPLTGLLNRRAWQERLHQALAEARRRGERVAVGLLDLDDFKAVNDRFGHLAGDKVLIALAGRLRGVLRDADILARLGGDEFALGFPLLRDEQEIAVIGERLTAALLAPYELAAERMIALGASLGLAFFPDHGETAEELLERADQALYHAKKRREGFSLEVWRGEKTPLCTDPPPPSLSPPLDVDPYGPEAALLLEPVHAAFRSLRSRFIDRFYGALMAEGEGAQILAALSEAEVDHLRFTQAKHLDFLLDPALQAAEHWRRAREIGRRHALVGVSRRLLMAAFRLLEHLLRSTLRELALPSATRRRLFDVILGRIMNEFAAEMEGEEEVRRAWQAAPSRIAAALEGCSGSDLCGRLTETMLAFPGIVGATLNRPNEEGVFVYEYTSGVAEAYAQAFANRDLWPRLFPESDPRAQGVTARAWREKRLAAAASYVSDSRQEIWQKIAPGLGIRSVAALPIRDGRGEMHAVLILFGAVPRLFETETVRLALAGIEAVLHLTCARLPTLPGPLLAAPVRLGLRQSLAAGRLEFHFQPFFALQRGGEIVGVEALARLRTADGQLLSPGRFLPAFGVEELRQLFIEGVHQTLSALAEWEAQGLRLGAASVNLPPELLSASDLVPLIERALAEYRLEPERLVFEILEQGVAGGVSPELPLLSGLIALGCPLAIDDLGAGENHLDRLSRLPLQGIKIDRGLTAQAARRETAMMMVGALLMLARGLGAVAAVEGLETAEEVEMAIELGASLGQGYALARPMPRSEIVGFSRRFAFPFTAGAPRSALGRAARAWRHNFERRHAARVSRVLSPS